MAKCKECGYQLMFVHTYDLPLKYVCMNEDCNAVYNSEELPKKNGEVV
jgi:hypothetical protein